MGIMIGCTERGDAALNLSWYDKAVDRRSAYSGFVLITKGISRPEFQDKVMALENERPGKTVIHACITGWGGTAMEPGAADYKTSVDAVKQLINKGFPADHIVIRIDPIFPTTEYVGRAADVSSYAHNVIPEVKRYRVSIYDDYINARREMIKRGFEPVDGIQGMKNEAMRQPTPEQVKIVAEAMINAAPEQKYELCAEPELASAYPEHFVWFGCISQADCDLMNVVVPEGTGINNQNRFGCRCLQVKKEMLTDTKPCGHNCAYCYWRRS